MLERPTSLFNRADSSNLMLHINNDCWPEENTWQIQNVQGEVIHEGGPYFGQSLAEINEAFWLESGTYTFTFYDAAGDGLYATQWGTCAENGNIELVDAAGNVLLQYDGTSNFDSLSVTFDFNATVSVQELLPAQSFHTYPNPFRDQLWIDIINHQPEPITIEIFSMDGRLQYRDPSTQFSAGQANLQLDVENLGAGTYLLRISAGNQTETQRIIKHK